jgi:predicted dehydrogenase
MNHRDTRRGFLKTAASSAAGWLILRDARSAYGYQDNQKLNIALVGAGGRGVYLLRFIRDVGENLVAVCDADRRRLSEPLKALPQVRKFQDFRKMLDEMDRQIDAVVVATVEHTHAVIAARSMKQGKHVYVEKPIAHDVAEARRLREIARQHKVATQMGNQGMAADRFRRTLELIQDGTVGEIREVHAWFEYGGSGPLERPKERPPVPEHVDWDIWLGPAPFRAYHPCYLKPAGWGTWRDFATGCLGGGGSHSINLAFKALNLRALWDGPEAKGTIRIETEVSEQCPENFPRWQIVRFDLPARGLLPPARIHWYNAGEARLKQLGIWERLEKLAGCALEWKDGSWAPRSGTLLVGTKGAVHTNAHNSACRLLPEKDFPRTAGRPQRLPRSGNHFDEWLQACKGGPTPMSNFDHSGPVMELLLLGNVASLVGQRIEFNPVACKIVNHPEADRALRPLRRSGWSS